MAVTPEMLDAMLAAGLTREQIAAVVKAGLAAQAAADEARRAAKRANNAERQQRYRDRHSKRNGSNALCDVTERDTFPLDVPPPQTPPPLNPPSSETVREARAREPSDWPEDFREKVWEAYGQRRDKKASMAALENLRRSRKLAWAELTAAIARQAENVEPQFRPSLERWIKREKWTDEYAPAAANGHPYRGRPPPEKKRSAQDVAKEMADRFDRSILDDDEPEMFGRVCGEAHPNSYRLLS